MNVTIGRFATPNGSKFLQQLCKHFGHKREVSFTETEGTCAFDFGTAYMTADAEGLTVRFEYEVPEMLERAHMVIDKHLARFAFREGFEAMHWGG